MSDMRRWQFWLGVAISLFFLGWVLKDLIPQFKAFIIVLRTATYGWLIPGVAIYFVAVWARAWRWHYLLRPVKSITTRTLFPITTICYMGNNIYPARAGEVLRAVILKRHESVPISASLATIIIERVFDGVVMLGFVFVNLSELTRLTGGSGVIAGISIQNIALWGSGIFFGALLVFLVGAMFPQQTEALVAWLSKRIVPARFREQVQSVTSKFLSGLEALRSPADALMVFVTSVVIWLLETGKYWFVMHAFHFEVNFFTLMLMNGVVNLATTIPSAPGYIGTFDKPGIAVLEAYGISTAVAAGYTLVLHLALWFPITAVGAIYLAREGLRWNEDLATARADAKAEAEAEG